MQNPVMSKASRALLPWLLPMAALVCAAPAQRVPKRVVPTPIDFSTGDEDNLYSLGRSQEEIHEWEAALDELAAGDARAAVERMHRLLQGDSGGVVPVAKGRFLGLRLAVVTTMANLPPTAIEAYGALVQREAGNLATRPLQELEVDQLALLADRFPTAALGLAARIRLGDLLLVAGRGREAAGHFRQALDATPIGSADERRVAERLRCAAVLASPATARAAADARTLDAAAEDVVSILPPSGDPATYPAIGGVDGRRPMSEPAGHPRPVLSEEVAARGYEFADSSRFAMFPTGDLDAIYVNTGAELLAFDPLRRSLHWSASSPMTDADRSDQFNKDMVLSAACSGDVVVAALQVPDKSVNVDFQAAFRIISKIPQRRLFAYSTRTGKQIWSHFDEMDGPRTRRFRGHDACAPPLLVENTVYTPVHDRSGAIAFSVAAYDAATGQPKWRRLVCSSQQDVNMFGNARMEFAASPLSLVDGVLFGSSNLGVTYALDAATGRIRWISSYGVVRMPRAMLQHQLERPVFFANNAPAVADGVVCMTPLDSQFALGLDTETGATVWRVIADAVVGTVENRVRWLAGALDDEFVLAGRGAIAVKARPDGDGPAVRQLVPPEALRTRGGDEPGGRPAVTADHVWFPAPGRILGFDRAGNPVAGDRQIAVAEYQPGNLLLVDGIIVSLHQRGLDVLLDTEALEQHVEARVATAPDDPAGILRLANLRWALLGDDPDQASRSSLRKLFARGLACCDARGLPKNHPTRKALQRSAYALAYEEATAAARRNDPRTLELLVDARDAAPDQRAFVTVQALVLARCGTDGPRLARELDLLEREAADARMPDSDVAVRVFVQWQRALLPGIPPAQAVAAWQKLLEEHGTEALPAGPAAAIAEDAIQRLIASHGERVYTDIAARADAALALANDDPAALQAVSRRFPNANAARTARMRLLDRSVGKGDLGLACDVLAQALRSGGSTASIDRRVLVAAIARGNQGLAHTMVERLKRHAAEASDWPADQGATYEQVVAAFVDEPAPPAPAAQLPIQEVARLPVRSPGRETHHLLPVVVAEGFAAPADRPLFAMLGRDLQAIDLTLPPTKAVLFAQPVESLLHVVACGPVLVVPDFERVFALDHRTGKQVWELPRGIGPMFECLGVQGGVLHVFAFAQSGAGGELLGVEPLTGAILFRRQMPGDGGAPVPKPVPGHLLAVASGAEGPVLQWLDPLTGEVARTVALSSAAVREHLRPAANGATSALLPQRLCADGERVFVPIDAASPTDAAAVLAIDSTGALAWSWTGGRGGRVIVAVRGDRLVVVESADDAGRAVLLGARDGGVLHEVRLGPDAKVLNLEIGWLPTPAPRVLALSDRQDPNSRRRRFVAFGVDADQPTFEVRLTAEDGEIDRHPIFGDDFVTFGVRPSGRGAYRLWSIHLRDRSGALPTGLKYQRLNLPSPHGLGSFGPYTVVTSSECLVVLGAEPLPR